MTHLLPAWVHLQQDAHGLDFHDWDPQLTPHNAEVVKLARENNLNIVPVFSNAQISSTGPAISIRSACIIFLTNPALQTKMIM